KPQATAASGNVSITTSNGNTASTERVRELEELHQRSKAVSEKQKEQLEKLEADNAKLLSQVTELNVRFTKLSDEDYSQTDLFKQLKSQHEDVIKRINHLEALNIQLREEAQSLQAERTAYRIQIENESQAAVKEKESQLTKAEFDLARIRNTRDELLADQAVKKSVLDQERTATAHSKELLEARDQRIQSLESEVERLRLQIDGLKEDGGGTEGGGGADVENMGIEDLRTNTRC
ncbi:E3 ubiquitin-protein ligase bre1, partial [Ascosphaera atra]